MFDTVIDNFRHQRVQTKRGSHQITNFWVFCRCLGCKYWNILRPMAAGEQEIGVNNHRLRSTGNASTERVTETWRSQFHMGRFDNGLTSGISELAHNLDKQLVAGGSA